MRYAGVVGDFPAVCAGADEDVAGTFFGGAFVQEPGRDRGGRVVDDFEGGGAAGAAADGAVVVVWEAGVGGGDVGAAGAAGESGLVGMVEGEGGCDLRDADVLVFDEVVAGA